MQQSCTYGSVRGAAGQPSSLPRQKSILMAETAPISDSVESGINDLQMLVSAMVGAPVTFSPTC